MTTEPTLSLLVFKTRQIDNLLSFYRTIGVALTEEQHSKVPLHYAGKLGATMFELYPMPDTGSVDSSTRVGFRVSNMVETVQRLRSGGTPIVSEPAMTEWGSRAVVRDPDGRAVELYQQ